MNFLENFGSDTAVLVLTFLILVVSVAVMYFYLKNLQELLTAIREPNRTMAPAGVWLIAVGLLNNVLTIPVYFFDYDNPLTTVFQVLNYMILIFVVIWHYRVVMAIATSIEAEYDSRSISIEHKPTLQTGMFMVVAQALVLIREVSFIGVIGRFAALGYLIAFIMYWVRTYKFKKEIQAMSQQEDEDSLIFKDLL